MVAYFCLGWSFPGQGVRLLVAVLAMSGFEALAQEAKEQDHAGTAAERVARAIEIFKDQHLNIPERWEAIREMATLGSAAVPALVNELDQATDNLELRSLGFTLRAIGDPRAVPALIRAIPRTLVKAGSDMGLRHNDPEMLAFLQQHDLNNLGRGQLFGFGMPYREITGALETLTGEKFRREELHFVDLSGGPISRYLKLKLFHELAADWAAWWNAHAKEFTDDPAFMKVSLPPLPPAPRKPGHSNQPFPLGAGAREGTSWRGSIVGPPQPKIRSITFVDMDTGRQCAWPSELPAPEKAKPEDVERWAAKNGYDLQGVEYHEHDPDRSFHAIRLLGARAWLVDDAEYEKIENRLRAGDAPALDRPVKEYLLAFDPETGKAELEKPAAFLFETREGSTGILRTTAQITELFEQGDLRTPVQKGSKRGFYLGVKYDHKLLYESNGGKDD